MGHLAGEKIEWFGDENARTGGTSVSRPEIFVRMKTLPDNGKKIFA